MLPRKGERWSDCLRRLNCVTAEPNSFITHPLPQSCLVGDPGRDPGRDPGSNSSAGPSSSVAALDIAANDDDDDPGRGNDAAGDIDRRLSIGIGDGHGEDPSGSERGTAASGPTKARAHNRSAPMEDTSMAFPA